MTTTIAERSAVPFHLSLIEPIDEATITGYPVVEGAYDPVDQTWKLPAGTDPMAYVGETFSHTLADGKYIIDDVDYDVPPS
jgi:hypothetical protein